MVCFAYNTINIYVCWGVDKLESFTEIFAAVKNYCKEHVATASYDVFFADMEPVSFEGGIATLAVRSLLTISSPISREVRVNSTGTMISDLSTWGCQYLYIVAYGGA